MRDTIDGEAADPSRRDLRRLRHHVSQRALRRYKAHRPEPPEDLMPQFRLIREAVRAFDLPCIEQEGFEADDLIATYACEAADTGGDRHHRLLRQGPDAAHRPGVVDVRLHEGRSGSTPRGDREVRRAARKGGGRAGARRRLDRQRAGRSGHRRQDGGAAHQRIRRPRNAARPRRRDQAAEAPRGADRSSPSRRDLEQAGAARELRAAEASDRGARRCASPIRAGCSRS